KGRLRLFICGPDGRHPLMRLSRHRSPNNEPLDHAARGDAVSIQDATTGDDGLRVTADTIVTLPTSPERA
ncbi:MAG TPA: hypothetical protein VN853_15110, partial [Polyangia bacterium]|nr:hypothetical protein [Polyangia bacterium]